MSTIDSTRADVGDMLQRLLILQDQLGSRVHDLETSLSSTKAALQVAEAELHRTQAELQSTRTELQAFKQDVHIKHRDFIARRFDSACSEVFRTPELMEKILLECSMTDLLCRTPRVSKGFKATIDDSISLQQTLFLAPQPFHWNRDEYLINPLLTSPRFLDHIKFRDWGRPTHPLHMEVSLGPSTVFSDMAGAWRRGQSTSISIEPPTTAEVVKPCFVVLIEGQNPCRLPRQGVREGSWKRMFFTQPPMQMLWKYHGPSRTMLQWGTRYFRAETRALKACNTVDEVEDEAEEADVSLIKSLSAHPLFT
jgi:hypothetical protein